MNVLSRIFARTPSLRTRVVLATAIGAAIPVLIVGTVVWVGITNDRKERLDRRLDEAAGFAIPFLPRGLNEIPSSPNDRDAIMTIRRGATATSSSETITVGPLEVDIPGRRARVNGVDVDLTKREFDLLAVLAEHKTAVLSRAQLLELVWGYDFAADTNVVDVFIGYLRRKLEAGGAPRLLHTVRGVGFVLRTQ